MDLNGLHVVVTGAIAGYSRTTAEAFLRDKGALIQSAVTSKTDLLVCGDRVGASKTAKARELGVRVVSWDEAVNGGPDREKRGPDRQPVARAKARTIAPQLAKKADELPHGPGWLYEVKWDGIRGIATVRDGAVSIQSRSAKTELSDRYPHIAAALSRLPDCVLDGELVDLSTMGGSFEGLRNGGVSSYVVFDLLSHPPQGEAVMEWPLRVRKELLNQLLAVGVPGVGASPVFLDGEELLAYADANALEGIVAKRAESPYREGTRTEAWLKIKLRQVDEFVVVGWTPGEGARLGMIGSLVLAYLEEPGRYVYCGRVGSGIGDDAELKARLKPVRPWDLVGAYDVPRDATWVVPEVVVQVAYQRVTEDGRLWHPSYKGLRDDVAAADVRRPW